MANPTTNYGFVLPTPTDLVTDLPADFDVALQGVDTRLKALQPGTTLGDIAYSSATANTNTRLAVGANGTYLTVTAGVPAWGAVSAGGMTLLSTTNLSGASTTISSIDQTYINLFIVIRNPHVSSVGTMVVQPNSVDNSGYYAGIRGNTVDQRNSIGLQEGVVGSNALNSTVVQISQYANTSFGKPTQFYGTTAVNNDTTFNYAGTISTTSAITSIKFQPQTGTFSGGSVLIYGVK